MGALLAPATANEFLRVLRVLNEMGAMRVRLGADGSVDVAFFAVTPSQDQREEDAEREQQRRKREEEDDLYGSSG